MADPVESKPEQAPTKALTPSQLRVVQAIRAYRSEHGVSPTYQEVGDALGMSKTAAADHIKHCVRKGVLRVDAGRRRSIEPVDEELIARQDAVDVVSIEVEPGAVQDAVTQGIRDIPARR